MSDETATPAPTFLFRVDAVADRLEKLASASPPTAMTDADPPTGERWEWGQVWAHVAEFTAYWTNQIRRALDSPGDEPAPFGRVKTDPVRLGAIERDRATPVGELWERTIAHLQDTRRLLADMTAQDWQRRGAHSTLGIMSMSRIVDGFIVSHLEEHAEQLEELVRAG
jgi:DinB family protein